MSYIPDPWAGQYDEMAWQTGRPYSNQGPDLGNLQGGNYLEGLQYLGGQYNKAVTPMAEAAQRGLRGAVTTGRGMVKPALLGKVGRFAASPHMLTAMKALPAIGAAGAVVGAGDVLFGGDSAANKVMDGAGMTIGGILGAPFGGPIGAAAGAGIGKTVSDGIQGLGGMLGIKSEKERKLEEALRALNGGVI